MPKTSQLDLDTLEGLQLMKASLDAIKGHLAALAGGNGVLYSGTIRLAAVANSAVAGQSQGQLEVHGQYRSVHVVNLTGAAIIVAAGPAGNGQISGPGAHSIPVNAWRTMNVGGGEHTFSIIGTPSGLVGVELFTMNQAPNAGTIQ